MHWLQEFVTSDVAPPAEWDIRSRWGWGVRWGVGVQREVWGYIERGTSGVYLVCVGPWTAVVGSYETAAALYARWMVA